MFYDVRDPVGLPVVCYEHTWTPGVTSEVWRAEHTPYGDRLAESGDVSLRPPWRFLGQLELEGSDASVWNAGEPETLRAELCLNQWRVYDPRVGQYLTPEPWAVAGAEHATHGYGYAGSAPADYSDPDGREPITIAGVTITIPAWVLPVGAAGLGAAAAQWLIDHLGEEAAWRLINGLLNDICEGTRTLEASRPRRRGQRTCRCTFRHAPSTPEAMGCPPRVYATVGTGVDIGTCQAEAKLTAPLHCRRYYGRCSFL